MKTEIDKGDAIAGILFILAGLFFAYQSLGMELGTSLRMGPGYFPLVLAGVLILLGVTVMVKAVRNEAEPIGPLAIRGILLILPAPIFFGLTVRGLGFVVSLFLTALIAAFASRKMKPHYAVLLAVLVTIFSTLVFSYALGLPFQRFGPWLRF
ncbi:tripartite tricarboxylate transporter TctB family protein [Falsirhodobacter xinxiangensis]|uniref:tripartite tricarboxylate transporter TctB family protein n=1 Tax=Falsirhodobacter xinxiangensis TaxID=2530049 RepID=UPI0010A99BFB|nr:tripartite tricarboxylate transporter TctB family protein [Rhodobacter xinxiangensis]